jgi:hypothetical protein
VDGKIKMIFLIIAICGCVLFFSVRAFRKYDLEFYKKRQEFIAYLDSINDIETLKQIGEINFLGVREKWYPKYANVIPYLEKKIRETDDENFILYLFEYEKFGKKFLLTVPFIVLSIMIPLACIVSIFRK